MNIHILPESSNPVEIVGNLALKFRESDPDCFCICVIDVEILGGGVALLILPKAERDELAARDERFRDRDIAIVTAEQALEIGLLTVEELLGIRTGG